MLYIETSIAPIPPDLRQTIVVVFFLTLCLIGYLLFRFQNTGKGRSLNRHLENSMLGGRSIVEIWCRRNGENHDDLFRVNIESPEKHPISAAYFCRVTSPENSEFQFDVIGATPERVIRAQALVTAALKLVKILLD